MFTRRLIGLVGAVAVVSACGGSAPEPAPSAAALAPDAPFEVAACDTFLQKYAACIEQASEDVRDGLRGQLARRRQAWAKVAVLDATKSTLATLCVEASRQVPTELESYGCSW